jgi:flagellar secretion chaperone FliS
VTELLSALRLDVGEVAQNLYRLYDYMLRAMVQASVKNDRAKVEEVLRYLVELRESWEIAIHKVKNDAAALSVESVVASGGWTR